MNDAEFREATLAGGWSLVHASDEIFQVETPVDFQPRIDRAA